MPRGNTTFNTEANRPYTSPLYLVRLINIEPVDPLGQTQSLYLNSTHNKTIHWVDETGTVVPYLAAGLRVTQIAIDSKNPISTAKLSMCNVRKNFSAVAQYYHLNGTEVHLYRAFHNTINETDEDGAQLLMIGHLKKAVISNTAIAAEVWCDFSLKKKIPRVLYSVNLFPYLPASKDVRQVFMG